MPLHLITGYKGEPHISAEDVGAFNAGVVGRDEYVFATGNQFRAEMISNNAVKISDGDLMMHGRHASLRSGTMEELTIANGEPDKNRNDIIVARYTKDSQSGVEDISFVVVKGESVAGTPSDPELNRGDILSGNCLIHDMPLYRVKLSGSNITEVQKMFRVIGTSGDSMTYRGWNPFTSVDEDTPRKWRELGSGYWMIDIAEQFIGQPSQWGILYSTVFPDAEEVSQTFVVQASGETFRRNANGKGWYGTDWKSGTWIPMYDQSTFPIQVADYWGDAKHDGSNPRKITFNFEPKFIVVLPTAEHTNKLFAINGQPFAYTRDDTDHYVNLTWSGKSVSWYSNHSAVGVSARLDRDGVHYFVIAIG